MKRKKELPMQPQEEEEEEDSKMIADRRDESKENSIPASSSSTSSNTSFIPVNTEPLWKRTGAALFYGLASIAIMLINKQVLTVNKFPSPLFLGLGQMASSIIILRIGKKLKLVHFPDYNQDVIYKVFPLPLFYIANMLFGLASTQELSLPMMTALRRFSILFTMILSYYYLNHRQTKMIQFTVFLMIFGAIIAAADDLSFNFKGYIFITLNNLATAGQNVTTKSKLNSRDLGKFGIIYYNCLFMIVPAIFINYGTGDLESSLNYQHWNDLLFSCLFFTSCVFGFILMYSTTLCTQINSALDTTMVGTMKNILITYIGMVFGGDYIFSWWNFAGLNFSIIGTLLYTKASLSQPKPTSNNNQTTNSSSVLKSVSTS